jgi:8-oxo-dGTP diphosphatase
MTLLDGEMKQTTLCFVFDWKSNALLMIEKKRGQGAGKWNVPGGKIQKGESAESTAARETLEETGILPSRLSHRGTLEFYFPKSKSWDNICQVFVSEHFTGNLIPESEECYAHWISLDKIPYEKMWDDDRHWLPELLKGKQLHRTYIFDEKDQMEREIVKDPQ